MPSQSLRPFLAIAALAAVFYALPALAEEHAAGDSMSENLWAGHAPTRELGTDSAKVLEADHAYVTAGGGLGGSTLAYTRGLGHNSEMGIGVSALYTLGAASNAFAGGVGAAWKQHLFHNEIMGVAATGTASVMGLGVAPMYGVQFGIPVTYKIQSVGQYITAEPRVTLPNLATGTTDLEAEVSLGYHYRFNKLWALMLDVAPTYAPAKEFKVPVGVGMRFAANEYSHVDFMLGEFDTTPTFGAKLGLVSVLGHVGF
jgi:hypothetical protein